MTALEFRRRHRDYGIRIPSEEIPGYLACGWRLIDDCPGCDYAMLRPPACFDEDFSSASRTAPPIAREDGRKRPDGAASLVDADARPAA